MAKPTVLIVEDSPDISQPIADALLFADFNTLSPYSVLVLLHRGSPRASIRELAGRFRTISLDIRQQDLPLWIREKARQHGFALSNDAIEYLIGIVGPDIGLISSELEKFILIGKKSVDVQDIKALIRGSNDYDAFDLVHAREKRGCSEGLQDFESASGDAGVIRTPGGYQLALQPYVLNGQRQGTLL